MRHKGDLGLDPEAADVGGTKEYHFSDFACRRLGLDMRIGEKKRAFVGNHETHGREIGCTRSKTDNVPDKAQVEAEPPVEAAEHGICIPAPDGNGRNDRRIRAYETPRRLRRHASAARRLQARFDITQITRIEIRINELEIFSGAHCKPEPFDTGIDHIWAANEYGRCYPFLDHCLRGAKYPFILAFRIYDSLRVGFGGIDHGPHDKAGPENKLG